MKRSSIVALVIGALVSASIIALHASRVLASLEDLLRTAIMGVQPPGKAVGALAQYGLVILLSLGAAWLAVTSARGRKIYWALGILALELLLLSWIALLYETFFQPLPSLLAVGLGLVTANGYTSFAERNRSFIARNFFGGRLGKEHISRLAAGEVPFEAEPKCYEVTAVVCDIANKHDLGDDLSPAEVAAITEKFLAHATESFLSAGAYIEAVTGEGVVALFGFPAEDPEQAEGATRHALSLLEDFEKLRGGRDEAFRKFTVHFGISSGQVMIAPVQRGERAELLGTGEPVELARRFCIANRFYGSRILIGPRTFELASKSVIARPIDFLSGVDVRERHEIYEPLKLATDATPEEIARRDSFWNGVVLYREKRWAEAYSQFQKARGPNDLDDAPLQLYVRRLEPLALHLTDSPLE